MLSDVTLCLFTIQIYSFKKRKNEKAKTSNAYYIGRLF